MAPGRSVEGCFRVLGEEFYGEDKEGKVRMSEGKMMNLVLNS